MTGSDRALEYARAVVDGRINVGRFVRLACQRFLLDLDRESSESWPYRFDRARADEEIDFIELLPHVKGKWGNKGQRLKLEPWQCFIEANLFGFVHAETGLRRFLESYEEVPRKNGKSTRLAGRGLFMLTADRETGAEVYSGATTEKQALEVFRPAWLMAKQTEGFCDSFSIELAGNARNPGTIYRTGDMSRFEPIIGKPGDGPSPHAALIDEYHEHDSDHMVDSMKTGMGAREQPLLSIITTAGSNLGGPCYEKRRDVIRILEGQAIDERIFGAIWCLDEGDAWDDPASLKKANPNYGISVFPEYLEAVLSQARRSASKQNSYRTKHLNEWVGARMAWMNMVAWQRQKRDMRLEDFKGCRCWAAADLASKIDLSALIMLFERDGQFYCIPRFYAPEDAAADNDRYRIFATEGSLTLTPGNATDFEFIEEDILKLAKQVRLQELCVDDYQANYFMTRLQNSRIKVVNYGQTVKNMSEPMKEVEARILAGSLWHDGNSAMTWNMGNVVARVDAKENIFPRKEIENSPHCKIDGAVALIMAMGSALLNRQPPNYRVFFVGK